MLNEIARIKKTRILEKTTNLILMQHITKFIFNKLINLPSAKKG